MKVHIASDHTGFHLKAVLIDHVRGLGHEAEDGGAWSLDEDDDYPDFILPVAHKVVSEKSVGIILGGSGQGEAMCANRVQGVRALVFYGTAKSIGNLESSDSVESAELAPTNDGFDIIRLGRMHNDANILSLAARFLSEEEVKKATELFLSTPFSGSLRHIRRIAKF